MAEYAIERRHGTYNRQTRTEAVRYIVCHYTGSGTSKAGSASANCTYFAGGNRNASAHYFVDDGTICEYADPATYATWHCGDGRGRYGITNQNSVGIEVCQNGDRPYTEAEIERLAWLVRRLMAQFGVPAEHVVRHYDASRKACPYYYTPSGAGGNAAWAALRARITSTETEEDELTPEQAQMLQRIHDEVKRTDDCTGRGRGMLDHDKLMHMAAKQADMVDEVVAIKSTVNEMLDMLKQFASK